MIFPPELGWRRRCSCGGLVLVGRGAVWGTGTEARERTGAACQRHWPKLVFALVVELGIDEFRAVVVLSRHPVNTMVMKGSPATSHGQRHRPPTERPAPRVWSTRGLGPQSLVCTAYDMEPLLVARLGAVRLQAAG